MAESKVNLPFCENGLMRQMFTNQVLVDNGRFIITDAGSSVYGCFWAEKILRSLLCLNEDLVSLGTNGEVSIHPLTEEVISLLAGGLSDLLNNFSRHKFTPLIEVFLETVRGDEVYGESWLWSCVKGKVDYLKYKSEINGFARMFIYKATSMRHVSLRDGRRRYIDKNLNSTYRYIENLFFRYSKILVLRVDFSYLRGYAGNATAQSAKRHLQLMLKNYQNKRPFKGMVGYIWKLEFSEDTGFHFHFMAFFDGSNHCHDVYLAQKIGEEWCRVTKGLGRYYNCNACADRYTNLGLGMVNRTDKSKVGNVKLAASYLAKMDYYVRLFLGEKDRIFGKGELPRTLPRKPGRPSKKAV